jgi:hypothetical protein
MMHIVSAQKRGDTWWPSLVSAYLHSWYSTKKLSGQVVFLVLGIFNLTKDWFSLPPCSLTIRICSLRLFLSWSSVFISMDEKCLYYLYAFLTVSLHSPRRVKRLAWLWKNVRYSMSEYLCRSRKHGGNLYQPCSVFRLIDITLVWKTV